MTPIIKRLRRSLVWSMTLLLIGSTGLAWLLFSTVLIWQSEAMTHALLVTQHQRFASMLWNTMRDTDDARASRVHPLQASDTLEFALYSVRGELINASSHPALPFFAVASDIPRSLRYAGRDRLISSRSNAEFELVVASPDSNANALAHELTERVALLALLALLALIPLLTWALRRGLRPIQRFALEVSTRAADNLGPIRTPVPSELAPLKRRLNTLFAQVEQAIAREQRFTADAAHELRTPLAAIRLQLELAQNSRRPEVRERAFTRATAAIDRTTHVVSQLLLLARLEHGHTLDGHPMNLAALVRDALTEAGLPCDSEHLRIQGEPALLGQALLLSLLLRNLFDNAQRYGGNGMELFVELFADRLTVYDTGCGMAPEHLARLGERFYRSEQTQDGVGLGWSIILRIAQLHGFTTEPFAHEPHGFGATFRFPCRAAISTG